MPSLRKSELHVTLAVGFDYNGYHENRGGGFIAIFALVSSDAQDMYRLLGCRNQALFASGSGKGTPSSSSLLKAAAKSAKNLS
eukprot:scaffold105387_cov18-Prasinocladus_malaysianus.AAC.1